MTTVAAMPPTAALRGPHASPTTISGSGARLISNSEIAAPDVIEANINADAKPAASAMDMVAIISCPAPFERLEVLATPTIGNRTTRKPYEDSRSAANDADRGSVLANDVRQQTEKTRALDGAREFALLFGGDGVDAARHDLAALGYVSHQQLGILVIDLRRVRTRERAGLATAEKRTACTSFSHDSYSSIADSSSRGRQGPRPPR